MLINGDLMGGQNNMQLPTEVAPGQTIDISMNFTAPLIEKNYRGNWQIRNEKGELFGVLVGVRVGVNVSVGVFDGV